MIRTTVVLFCLALSASLTAQEQSFESWLEDLRADARALGISDDALAALDGIAPLERVIELDNSQPEFVQTFTRYIELRVTPGQISRGQQLLEQHAQLLSQVQNRYGIQPPYLVAFWAVESNYGRATGGFHVIEALATLAYDPRRSEFFRRELLTALQIIDAGHIASERMTGSWAGAMGQLQFLPSVFDRFAVDGDQDGRIDIWNSLPDVFHSAANFLSQSGWQGDQRWGREVILPRNFDYSQTGSGVRKSLQEWSDRGVLRVDGSALPIVAGMDASIILPAGAAGPAFLAYANFRATMNYNPSTFYALTVGHLADRYNGGRPIQRMPEDEQSMSVVEVTELQSLLNAAGYDSGAPDGRVGPQTRGAIRAYQSDLGLPMDGYASKALLDDLQTR